MRRLFQGFFFFWSRWCWTQREALIFSNLDEVESGRCAEWVEHGGRGCQISCGISWGIMGAERGGCALWSYYCALCSALSLAEAAWLARCLTHLQHCRVGISKLFGWFWVNDTRTLSRRLIMQPPGTLHTHSQRHIIKPNDKTAQQAFYSCVADD